MLLQIQEGVKTLANVAQESSDPTTQLLIAAVLILLAVVATLFLKYDGLNKENRNTLVENHKLFSTMNTLLEKSIEHSAIKSSSVAQEVKNSEKNITAEIRILGAQLNPKASIQRTHEHSYQAGG